MFNTAKIGAVALLALMSGCANLATISRTTTIPPVPEGARNPAFAGGMAIHLDASQRLFYQANGHFCAEPMPDALQSLASSTGVGVGVGDKASAAVSDAFSSNAASIGLHTQSTTLMRDQYYRICELAANTNMAAPQVAQLMERAQRYTLGILAVEQLTGAVVAQQAAVSSDANSSSAASLGATIDALSKAQTVLTDKKAAADAANDALDEAKAQADKDAKAVADPSNLTADEKAQQATDQAAVTKADANAKTATANLALAQKSVDVLTSNLGTAQSSASAAAKGSAALGASATHSNIDSATATAIATATDSIVSKLLDRGDIVDSCMAMMMDAKGDEFLRARPTLLQSCLTAIDTAVSVAGANAKTAFRMVMTLDPDTSTTLNKLNNTFRVAPESGRRPKTPKAPPPSKQGDH